MEIDLENFDAEEHGINIDVLTAGLCRKSLYDFVKEFWDTIIPEDPIWNFHIEFICAELERVTPGVIAREPKMHDLLINIPPGSTKSTIITIMYPAWLWTLDPSLRIISNSYSGDISTEHAVKSRDIILSEKYKRLFPYVVIRKDKSGKQSYDNTEGGARYTTSTGGTIMGKHAHVIVNDDPQNQQQSQSEVYRKQAIEHTKALSSRKVNKESAVTVTVMQRLHMEDVSGYLLDKKRDEIHYIKLPAQLTAKTRTSPAYLSKYYVDDMLDPIRLGPTAIKEAKVDLGTRAYNGQWGQNPTAEGGDIIHESWFKYINHNDFIEMMAKRGQDTTIEFFIDTAYTDSTENDPTGILAACKVGNYLYITASKKYYLKFPDLIRAIPEFTGVNGYTDNSTIRIEPKASGKSVVQSLVDNTRLNVMELPTPKDSKTTRLYAVSPIIESGRVILVEGAWNEDFVDEVSGFPNMPNDEDVDTLCYAINHCLGVGSRIYETTESLADMGIAY